MSPSTSIYVLLGGAHAHLLPVRAGGAAGGVRVRGAAGRRHVQARAGGHGRAAAAPRLPRPPGLIILVYSIDSIQCQILF